nr:unnamed protein product [Digitaria exilis]
MRIGGGNASQGRGTQNSKDEARIINQSTSNELGEEGGREGRKEGGSGEAHRVEQDAPVEILPYPGLSVAAGDWVGSVRAAAAASAESPSGEAQYSPMSSSPRVRALLLSRRPPPQGRGSRRVGENGKLERARKRGGQEKEGGEAGTAAGVATCERCVFGNGTEIGQWEGS